MSDRLREPIGYIRTHGWDGYLAGLVQVLSRRTPPGWIRAAGLERWTLSRRDRLALDHLRGAGVEVGAQATPLRMPRGVRVRYVDIATREQSLRLFPHLDPSAMIDPDIISDGFTLAAVADASQDFVVANHVLEHGPDPIGALCHWLRVLRSGGILYATVPLAENTFDRGRALTSLTHLIEDHAILERDGADVLHERNRAHYDEWLRISHNNVARDAGNPTLREEELGPHLEWAMSERQEIHFHTFSVESYGALLRYVGALPGSTARLIRMVKNGGEVIAIVQRT